MADEQCIFCMIASNKIQSAKLYDDESCSAFLDIRPATKGHVQVISKKHAPVFVELDEAARAKMFSIAFNIGQTLVKKLKATGVSYIVNEGAGAGQRVAHAGIHVIPRYEGDEVVISWPDKQMSQEELSNYLNGVIAEVTSNASEAPRKPEPKPEDKPEIKREEKPKDGLRVKPRIPNW